MLHVENLHINSGTFVLNNISFSVPSGAYFVLLGASGQGKTLLVESIAGVRPPTRGKIYWNGYDITKAPIHRKGFVLMYQDHALFPHMTVEKNIVYGMQGRGIPRSNQRDELFQIAEKTGVRHLLKKYPGVLSGGERQRVALARALAAHPQCLLLDEPLSSLDALAKGSLRALLREIHRENCTILHVTHDYEDAMALATHVGILEGGTLVQTGTPDEVFQRPKSEFVARFVGIRNFFHGTLHASTQESEALAVVDCGPIRFRIVTESKPGNGTLIIRSEDVTLSLDCPDSSAQNRFQGTIKEIFRAKLGYEIMVDIGVEIAALVTAQSVTRLALVPGKQVWVSVKAVTPIFLES